MDCRPAVLNRLHPVDRRSLPVGAFTVAGFGYNDRGPACKSVCASFRASAPAEWRRVMRISLYFVIWKRTVVQHPAATRSFAEPGLRYIYFLRKCFLLHSFLSSGGPGKPYWQGRTQRLGALCMCGSRSPCKSSRKIIWVCCLYRRSTALMCRPVSAE